MLVTLISLAFLNSNNRLAKSKRVIFAREDALVNNSQIETTKANDDEKTEPPPYPEDTMPAFEAQLIPSGVIDDEISNEAAINANKIEQEDTIQKEENGKISNDDSNTANSHSSFGSILISFVAFSIIGIVVYVISSKMKRKNNQATLEEAVPFKFSMQQPNDADLSRHGFSKI